MYTRYLKNAHTGSSYRRNHSNAPNHGHHTTARLALENKPTPVQNTSESASCAYRHILVRGVHLVGFFKRFRRFLLPNNAAE